MSVIDDYLASLAGEEKKTIEHMYGIVRQLVPDATEELSYAMPAFKYKGKGLVAIIARKDFVSLYSFCSVERLKVELPQYTVTSGSIHFTPDNPIPDELLKQIVAARKRLIEA